MFNTAHSVLAGAASAAAAAILWGTAGTAQSFVSAGGPDPVWVGALRLAFSSAFFLPVLASGRRALRRDLARAAGGALPAMTLCAAAMVAYNFAFFAGAKACGVAVGSAVTLGSAPIWAGLMGWALGKRPGAAWCAGVFCAVAGGALMAARSAAGLQAAGLGFCLAAGFCYAGYAQLAKRLLAAFPSSGAAATGLVFMSAATMALPAALLFEGLPDMAPGDWAVVAYLGVVTTGAAYALFSRALLSISAASAVALTLLEPVTAFFAAIFIVGEPAGPASLGGLVLILAGLSAILRADAKEAVVAAPARPDAT